MPGICEDGVEFGRRACEATVRPTSDAGPQHPYGLFTTASLLWPIVAGMHTNEAISAYATLPPSERPDGHRRAVAGAREVA